MTATTEAFDHETLEGRRAAFDAWSARKKRELGPFAGLGWAKTNTGGWCFSRHWPHLLCWSWSIWITPYRGKHYDGPRRFSWLCRPSIVKQIALGLWFFTISLHWQSYDRIRALGPTWADAPPIYSRAQLDR